MSNLEEAFAKEIEKAGLPACEREYRFSRDIVGHGPGIRARLKAAGLRDWRFDFAWPSEKVAVEIDGGVWSRGRHVRGAGFVGDMEKLNVAVLANWKVLRFSANHIRSGYALDTISRALRR